MDPCIGDETGTGDEADRLNEPTDEFGELAGRYAKGYRGGGSGSVINREWEINMDGDSSSVMDMLAIRRARPRLE
jgi:hypothetical protein